jgi:hypothetical protein
LQDAPHGASLPKRALPRTGPLNSPSEGRGRPAAVTELELQEQEGGRATQLQWRRLMPVDVEQISGTGAAVRAARFLER